MPQTFHPSIHPPAHPPDPAARSPRSLIPVLAGLAVLLFATLFLLRVDSDDLRGDLVGELGLYGPPVGELEGVSSLDLPANQREYRSIFHELDPQGVYSFLYIYDLASNRIKTYVYEGSVVGENRIYLMSGDTTAEYPIRPEDDGFTITFGSTQGGSIGENGVPTYGWEYKNLKVYLERTTE